MIIAQMQQSGRPHAGQYPSILNRSAHHAEDPASATITRPMTRKAGSNNQSSQRMTASPNTRNKPTGSIFSKRLPQRCGNNPANTRPPSSGGMGNRLNTAENPR